MKIKKYKVVDEYKHFYLAMDERGFKECFQKALYKPDEEGNIIVTTLYDTEKKYKVSKINRNFNPMNSLKKY